ncbi:hypothetical protein [Paenibacillus sp. JJ-223]|uniref:hypothetical protein n=1 Tax=Paenibacillus sp. JJ-223 TaxID=2905647 RepID=UPI001F350BC0|nr:hypothetical protein [Paenibacillus sp. JJ-223]CAH1211647.1 hypothetical protein PAECIP111890_03775 [Paenibacillus sp. JJ-223]
MRKMIVLCCTILVAWLTLAPLNAEAAMDPKALLKKKYPSETVTLLKSADLNGDNKKEYFMLTASGNFYLVNAKGTVVLIDSDIVGDEEFESPSIHIYQASKKEKHVAVTFGYFPSNTQLYAYKYKNGTLQKKLSVMGDQGVAIQKDGKIKQSWKKYLPEGGWNLAAATYTWNATKDKYIAAGQIP